MKKKKIFAGAAVLGAAALATWYFLRVRAKPEKQMEVTLTWN